MEQRDLGAYAALMSAQLLFATLPVAGKVGLEGVHFLVFSFVRMAGAGVVLMLGVHLLFKPKLPARQDLGRLALYAVFGIVINQVLFLWGLTLTTATNAALIITSIPVFTYAIALLAGHETLDVQRGLGILVALTGVLVLIDPRSFSLTGGSFWGDLLILTNSISYALYLVISRPLLKRVPPLTMTAWLFAFGTLITAPILVAVTGLPSPVNPSWQLPTLSWVLLAYIVVGPTVGTYTLNLVALSRVASSTVAAFIYVQPVAAVFLAWLLLGEQVGLIHLVSGGLVLAGVTLVSVRRS